MYKYPYFAKQVLLHEKYIQMLIPMPLISPLFLKSHRDTFKGMSSPRGPVWIFWCSKN